jgi:hypothetical protein
MYFARLNSLYFACCVSKSVLNDLTLRKLPGNADPILYLNAVDIFIEHECGAIILSLTYGIFIDSRTEIIGISHECTSAPAFSGI